MSIEAAGHSGAAVTNLCAPGLTIRECVHAARGTSTSTAPLPGVVQWRTYEMPIGFGRARRARSTPPPTTEAPQPASPEPSVTRAFPGQSLVSAEVNLPPIIDASDVTLGRQIGTGTFKNVYEGALRVNDTNCTTIAVLRIRSTPGQGQSKLRGWPKEAVMLHKLSRHMFITTLIGAAEDN